jgi:hypothetical protein
MRAHSRPSLLRAGPALAAVLVLLPVLGACTKGGQFDPTEMFNSDVFDAKKKLTGQRIPVFPDGVPGTTTGVPADLVKGYQAPPDPSDADASQTPPADGAQAPAKTASASPATAEAKPKPKLRPKPKVASAPAQQAQDPAWNQPGPAKNGPTRINVGGKSAAPAQSSGQEQSAAPQGNWPASPPAAAQPNWPSPTSGTATTPAQRVEQDWPSPTAQQKTPQ